MPWISYAQNAEDVRLRRAFLGQKQGIYIDVGANHPVVFSITKHFYEQGWSGINVEPLPKQFALVAADRTRDTNLNVGCSSKPGSAKLYAARGGASGMSSLTASEVEEHTRKGFEFDEINCQLVTLASVCETHIGERTVDFLSIDVEGHEREVLEGADFSRFRPRVVLLEATRPNSTEPTHERWEHLLLSQGYLFAAFDGLNRYYVRREDERLIPALALAPNVFDDFVPYAYQRQIDQLQAQLLESTKTRTMVSRLMRRAVKPVARFSHAANRLIERFIARRKGAGS
jgi:FkbM family methyltransferase